MFEVLELDSGRVVGIVIGFFGFRVRVFFIDFFWEVSNVIIVVSIDGSFKVMERGMVVEVE